jgi:pilus assembly protein CpaF
VSVLRELFVSIDHEISQLGTDPLGAGQAGASESPFLRESRRVIDSRTQGLDKALAQRLLREFHDFGPLSDLLQERDLTEIIVNAPGEIWVETRGRLHRYPERFLSDASYERILSRICHEAGLILTLEKPAGDGRWRDFRLHVVRPPAAHRWPLLSLRRHPENPWTLESLLANRWCREEQADGVRALIRHHLNFLVIGATGCGKTSVLNSLLREISPQERVGIIEDTDEIARPEGPSFKLLTREDPQGCLPTLDQSYLVRQCLRMRPDRLLMGEIRGGEAKDFLMALSTGHRGSFGTLHADSASQALIRLEMLIQMGAPHWSLGAIRKLIFQGLQVILCCRKNENGERRLVGAFRLVSLEETGFLLEELDLTSPGTWHWLPR